MNLIQKSENGERSGPRVMFLYECRFRNDGSPVFLRNVFETRYKELGLLEGASHTLPGMEDSFGNFDLYIWPDHGECELPVKDKVCPKPNIYWVSDTHVAIDYRLKKAEEFDMVCPTISSHVDIFKKHLGHDNVFWVPHAGEETCYRKLAKVKKYNVCFVGYVPGEKRINHLDRLFKEIPNFWYGQRFFEAASDIYNMSKIVFNNSVAGEANMRAFEATLSGSMLLTDYSLDLVKLGYEDGRNVAFYSSLDEMVEKAKYYLAHEDLREEIARCGYEHTLGNHTYFHRAKQMMDLWRHKRNV